MYHFIYTGVALKKKLLKYKLILLQVTLSMDELG